MESTWLKIGQFKVPYSRERLAYSGVLQFTERSIQTVGFNVGRDVGAAVHTYRGKLAATAGVFTGGGRDVPQRFLPEVLGIPMIVARVGYNDDLDKDIYTVSQNDLNPQRTQTAAYLNALYLRDTRIGHSTVLNVKTAEKSLLLNSNWNPFIAKTPFDRGELWQAGWDAAARGPIAGQWAWSTEAEMNYGRYSNRYGRIDLAGARVQAGVLKNPFEVALRYAVLVPDTQFANSGVPVTGTRPIQEVAPALTYYMKGHDMKIVADAPILIDVPVFTENGVGSYVSTEQPDQASVIKPATGSVERQTVPEARLMFQLAF
ncbi:MAG: hypothetical protein HYZ73_07590 [Elusimicrobia bacterium]|nr:hypothetical protein [Elusimicrobiota bacterium]